MNIFIMIASRPCFVENVNEHNEHKMLIILNEGALNPHLESLLCFHDLIFDLIVSTKLIYSTLGCDAASRAPEVRGGQGPGADESLPKQVWPA